MHCPRVIAARGVDTVPQGERETVLFLANGDVYSHKWNFTEVPEVTVRHVPQRREGRKTVNKAFSGECIRTLTRSGHSQGCTLSRRVLHVTSACAPWYRAGGWKRVVSVKGVGLADAGTFADATPASRCGGCIGEDTRMQVAVANAAKFPYTAIGAPPSPPPCC